MTIRGVLPAALIVLIGLSGCATAVIHPISEKEFSVMKASTPYTPDRDGYFVSKYYMKEIARVRVEDVNVEKEKPSVVGVADRVLNLFKKPETK